MEDNAEISLAWVNRWYSFHSLGEEIPKEKRTGLVEMKMVTIILNILTLRCVRDFTGLEVQ